MEEKTKIKIIQFQKINFNYIFFILFLISSFISSFIEENLDKFNDDSNNSKSGPIYEAALQITILYITTLSDYLAIIPFFINKFRSKGNAELNMKVIRIKTEQTASMYIYNDQYENQLTKNYKKVHLYSLLVGFFDFIPYILLIIYYWTNIVEVETYLNYLNSSVVFNILLQYILGYFILKTKFYTHHFFSFILNAICFLILATLDIINSVVYKIFDLKYILIYIAYLLFFAFEYAFGKKALINGFFSIYSLLIQKALYKTIFVIIFSVAIYFINKDIYFNIYDILSGNIIPIIALFIFGFTSNVFKWYVIEKFSPSYLPLPFVIEDIGYYISFLITGEEGDYQPLQKADLAVRIIIYVILFIGVMIHNEIFIINLCGLNLQTKLYLDKMVKQEELLSNTNNEEILKRYDSTIMEMQKRLEDENENNESNNNNEEYKTNEDNKTEEIKDE